MNPLDLVAGIKRIGDLAGHLREDCPLHPRQAEHSVMVFHMRMDV